MSSPQHVPYCDHDIVVVPVTDPPGAAIPLLYYGNGELSVLCLQYLCSPSISNKSSTMKDGIAKSLGLLYDFSKKVLPDLRVASKQVPLLLDKFCRALLFGTIQPDSSCPYGLYWPPRSWGTAQRYIDCVEKFSRWVRAEQGNFDLNPIETSFQNHISAAYSKELRAYTSLLLHLKNAADSKFPNSRLTFLSRSSNLSFPIDRPDRAIAFPKNKVWPMIFKGCKRQRLRKANNRPAYEEQFNIRNQLAFLLLFFGGLRESNLFHIFINDVFVDSHGVAKVMLYHPEKGSILYRAPGMPHSKLITREQYLREAYNLAPRNRSHKKMPDFAGWKNLLLEKGPPDYYATVHWIDRRAGILFWRLHSLYIRNIRPLTCNHPYYFINLSPDHYGKPWRVSGLIEAFNSAVRKVGLTPTKRYGTVPHGARHFYGQCAADMKIDPRVRQVMMHHRHILSQHRYQIPGPDRVNEIINEAYCRMGSEALPETGSLMETFRSTDPYAFLTDFE